MKVRVSIYLLFLFVGLVGIRQIDGRERPAGPPGELMEFAAFQNQSLSPSDSLLADSLLWVYRGMTVGVKHNRPEVFHAFLDPDKEGELQIQSRQFGYSSLRAYLTSHAYAWSDPDTLLTYDLVQDGRYARLGLIGPGYRLGKQTPQARYTFLLFRHSDVGWRLAAIGLLDKPLYDRYGHGVTYHDTELPTPLRFPKLF